jgi:NAD(P)-dependent dehydrogenase (short-subunit alcohol dehydrogenase family)
VEAVIQKALSHFGRIDLIANCSGTALIGACEDQSCDEIRNQFETNFMGTLNILQSSLPYFRQRMGGRYLVFSSTSAALGVPGIGPYCASKYAVEGLIEAMLYEVDAFNIKATLVEPGIVSRDDPQAHLPSPSPGDTSRPTGPLSQVNKQEHSNSSTDTRARKPDPNSLPLYGHFKVCPSSAPYDTPDHPAGHYTRMAQWLGDRQPTSVVKSAELVWQLGHCSFPPLRFLLGQLAVESIRDRLRCVIEEGEDWRNLNWPSEEGSGGVGGGGADEEKKDDDFREDGGEDRDKDLEQSADVEDGEDDMEPEAMDTQS